jgi:hypothetical protein
MSIVNKLIAENVLNGRSKLQSENENCRKQLALPNCIGGRVKFLPLAWAGMPKISFRKNSDSPQIKAGLLFCLHLRYRSDSDKTTGPTAIAD